MRIHILDCPKVQATQWPNAIKIHAGDAWNPIKPWSQWWLGVQMLGECHMIPCRWGIAARLLWCCWPCPGSRIPSWHLESKMALDTVLGCPKLVFLKGKKVYLGLNSMINHGIWWHICWHKSGDFALKNEWKLVGWRTKIKVEPTGRGMLCLCGPANRSAF